MPMCVCVCVMISRKLLSSWLAETLGTVQKKPLPDSRTDPIVPKARWVVGTSHVTRHLSRHMSRHSSQPSAAMSAAAHPFASKAEPARLGSLPDKEAPDKPADRAPPSKGPSSALSIVRTISTTPESRSQFPQDDIGSVLRKKGLKAMAAPERKERAAKSLPALTLAALGGETARLEWCQQYPRCASRFPSLTALAGLLHYSFPDMIVTLRELTAPRSAAFPAYLTDVVVKVVRILFVINSMPFFRCLLMGLSTHSLIHRISPEAKPCPDERSAAFFPRCLATLVRLLLLRPPGSLHMRA